MISSPGATAGLRRLTLFPLFLLLGLLDDAGDVVDLEQALQAVLADVVRGRRSERLIRHGRRNDGPTHQLDFLGEEGPAVALRLDEGIARVADISLDLGVDDAAGQNQILLASEDVAGQAGRVGFDSDAEKIELITLPAIRTCIVPPFWAMGSIRPLTGLTWGLATVGGGSPKKAPLPDEKTLAAGVSANAKRSCCCADVHGGVLDVAANQEVLDRAADGDG